MPADATTDWQSAARGHLRSELSTLQARLATRAAALRRGTLRHSERVWLNASAACPVPEAVIEALTRALNEPHVTLERGADPHTRSATQLLAAESERFCDRYASGQGTLVLGHNATHVLLALGRTLLHEQPGLSVAHGAVDHKASFALSSLPGWRQRVLVPYSDAGFYDRRTLSELAPESVLVLNVLHHMYGTLQHDALACVDGRLPLVLDLSQALSMLPAAQLDAFMSRAIAAVWNLGKTFSPTSLGVLWLRDAKLASRVLAINPELAGSVSGFSIKALASASSFLYEAVDDDWYRYVSTLTRYALARFDELPHLSLIGCRSFEANTQKLGIISFTHESMTPEELGMYLDAQGFAVRADGRCTADGVTSDSHDCVRISLLPHLTSQDIDALVEALRACA